MILKQNKKIALGKKILLKIHKPEGVHPQLNKLYSVFEEGEMQTEKRTRKLTAWHFAD